MKVVTCIDIENTGSENQQAYTLQDYAGNNFKVSEIKLRQLLELNKISVTNLRLLGDKIVEEESYKDNVAISKFMLFGKECKSECGHKYYIIESQDITILYIPSDVKYISRYGWFPEYCEIECNVLKVIGGSGLITARCMFFASKAKSIDLSEFDSANIVDMTRMFRKCKARYLNLESFKTNNVTVMNQMFMDCDLNTLDLSSFNTSKVLDMGSMFSGVTLKELDLSSFDTSSVEDMRWMFYDSYIDLLNIESFKLNNVTLTDDIFSDNIQIIKAKDPKLLKIIDKLRKKH